MKTKYYKFFLPFLLISGLSCGCRLNDNATMSTPLTPVLIQQMVGKKLLDAIQKEPDSDSIVIHYLDEPEIMESKYTWDYLYAGCCNMAFLSIALNRPEMQESAITLNKILKSAATGPSNAYYQRQLDYLDTLRQRCNDGFFDNLYDQFTLSAARRTDVIHAAYRQMNALLISFTSELKWVELQPAETRLQYIREQALVMQKNIGNAPEELTLAREIWALNCMWTAQLYFENRDTSNYLNLFSLYFLNELANSNQESAHCFVAEIYRFSAHDTKWLRQIEPIVQRMIRSNAAYVLDAFVAITKNH